MKKARFLAGSSILALSLALVACDNSDQLTDNEVAVADNRLEEFDNSSENISDQNGNQHRDGFEQEERLDPAP